MKTLYISDLDGTLLSPSARLTRRTINILNDLMGQGVFFTAATARSIASTKYILEELNLTLPIILMNGVCIYDPLKKEYIKVENFDIEDARMLISMIKENQLKGFMYTINKGILATYYEELANSAMNDFHKERVDRYKKTFTQIDNFAQIINESIVYFVLMDHKENLEELKQIVENLANVNSVFYKDNYVKDMWYLEIFPKKASKFHAVEFLRGHLNLDNIIGFGDNQNDVALFEACDQSYAVENAINELKLKADGIIGSNKDDAVAIWLKHNSVKSISL